MFRKCTSSKCIDYVTGLCTHRPSLLPIDKKGEALGAPTQVRGELFQIFFIRGRRSRNKVSVDESADGSLLKNHRHTAVVRVGSLACYALSSRSLTRSLSVWCEIIYTFFCDCCCLLNTPQKKHTYLFLKHYTHTHKQKKKQKQNKHI